MGNGPINEVIEEYKTSLGVDSSIRESYEQILKQYELSIEVLNFYTRVDPKLHDLYDWGLCDYFYKGTPEEISKAQLAVKTMKDKLDEYEREYPNLVLRKETSIVVSSTISSVYANLIIRNKLIEKEIQSRKKNKTR